MSSLKYSETKKLHAITVRVSKNDSAFLYFTFESNEGLAFYSTLEESSGESYRDIYLRCTPEYHEEVVRQLKALANKFPLEILEDKIIDDVRTRNVP